jgi:hypothetical protein
MESTVTIEQGSLNVSIASAFDAIMRAQRTLCYGNTTSNTTSTTTLKNSSVAGVAAGLRSATVLESFSSTWAGVGVGSDGPAPSDMGALWTRGLIDSEYASFSSSSTASQSDKKHEEKGSSSEQQHSPRASICGKHPAIRIYRRNGGQGSRGEGQQTGQS